jgi:iron complex outermembrane recepter protein
LWPLGLLLLAFSFPSLAQNTLSGSVGDKLDDNPLIGAHVSIPELNRLALSDSSGNYSFSDLPSGTYRIVVSYIGYETIDRQIAIVRRQQQQRFLLQSQFLKQATVTISAGKLGRNAPVAISNISSKEIRKHNLGQDLPVLIDFAPSVVSSSDAGAGIGYSSFRIRGSDQNRINVTINGIPLNDAESHGVYWVDLPDLMSSLEDIQLVRGVGSSVQGAGAFGASVNLRTRSPRAEPYAEAELGAGSFNTLRASVALGSGHLKDGWNFEARYSRIQSDGYINRAWSELNSGYLGASWLGKKTTLRLRIFSGHETTYQAWDGIPGSILDTNRRYNGIGIYFDGDGKAQYYDNQVDDYIQTHVHFFIDRRLAQNSLLSLALHYTRGLGYYEEYKEDRLFADYLMQQPQLGDSIIELSDLIQRRYLDNHFYGLVLTYEGKLKRWDLISGLGWNNYIGDHYGQVIWAQWLGVNNKDHEWYRNRGLKSDLNYYARANRNILEKTNLLIDLQGRWIGHDIMGIDNNLRDISQFHQYSFFNPKIGISHDFNAGTRAYLFAGMAHREPNRSNFTDSKPGLVPKPERLLNVEAGAQIKGSWYKVQIGSYLMMYKDQLVLTGEINDVGSAIMVNVDRSYRCGLELESELRIMADLKWMFNVTISQNRIREFNSKVDDWDLGGQREEVLTNRNIAFSPGIIAGSQLSYSPVKGLDINFINKFVGRQFIDNTSSLERSLEPYFLSNLLIHQTLKTRGGASLGLKVAVNNLFNMEYESNAWVYRYLYNGTEQQLDGYFPQAGRYFVVGLSLQI